MDGSAVVVLSGGQDSTTCLFLAKKSFDKVIAVTFDYGQRHRIELKSAAKVAEMAGVEHHILDATFINNLAASALTRLDIAVEAKDGQLPSTFVPGRNLFFLSMAAIFAVERGIKDIFAGVCETDYSGYPDCREAFVDSLEATIALALGGGGNRINIHTPLMFLTKAQSVKLAQEVGAMDALAHSHTCYEGRFPPCGACPSCVIRARGFAVAGVADPLTERAEKASL